MSFSGAIMAMARLKRPFRDQYEEPIPDLCAFLWMVVASVRFT